MRRRRLPWVIALGLAAAIAGIIFWPRHDDYAFLRGLHPKESFAALGPPSQDGFAVRRFVFAQSFKDITRVLPATWKQEQLGPEMGGMVADFELPNGSMATLEEFSKGALAEYPNQTTVLDLYGERPTWIQRQIEAIRGFFHL